LRRADFRTADNNAFFVDGDTIWRRERGQESQLTVRDSSALFEDHRVRLRLSPDFQIQDMALKQEFEGPLSLKQAAEMSVVLQGVTDSLPHLLDAST
jgi:hypothetical protein